MDKKKDYKEDSFGKIFYKNLLTGIDVLVYFVTHLFYLILSFYFIYKISFFFASFFSVNSIYFVFTFLFFTCVSSTFFAVLAISIKRYFERGIKDNEE